ncbi:hypothetical protein GCM10010269_52490 [Streptomyces humidus]|uniref:Uncharacterized protein n=1 Tax=Streptomyces humidus TaxID=52259 RepID=A0A918L5E1_9ACTN|nr:hypothetical protein GCM10010269_52490 [Streptomyces humidus]
MFATTPLSGVAVPAFARGPVGPAAALRALALYTLSLGVVARGSPSTPDVPASRCPLPRCVGASVRRCARAHGPPVGSDSAAAPRRGDRPGEPPRSGRSFDEVGRPSPPYRR